MPPPPSPRRRPWTTIAGSLAISLTVGWLVAQSIFTPERRHEARRLGRAIERSMGVERRLPAPPAPTPPASGAQLSPATSSPDSSVVDLAARARVVRFLRGGWIDQGAFGCYEPWTKMREFYPGNPLGVYQRMPEAGRWTMDWNLVCLDPTRTTRSDRLATDLYTLRLEPETVPGQPWKVAFQSTSFELRAGQCARVEVRLRADEPRTIQFALQDQMAQRPAGLAQRVEVDSNVVDFVWTSDPVEGDSVYYALLNLADSGVGVEIERLARLDAEGREAEVPADRYFVEYQMNSAGYRGEEFRATAPDGVLRVACLGDSFTFGIGVPNGATFSEALARELAEHRSAAPSQVLNFGISGSSPDQDLNRYLTTVREYNPQVVVLTLCTNDHVNKADDDALRARWPVHSREYMAAYWEHFVEHGFSKCVATLGQLQAACESNRARLIVGVFEQDEGDEWIECDRAVGQFCRERGVHYVNPRAALAREGLFGPPGQVYADHRLDAHPNAAAHAVYARELRRALEQAGLSSVRVE